MNDDEATGDRIRAALAGKPSIREVPMFGGLSFMVNGKMVAAVGRDGNLILRVDPGRNRELLMYPGASPAEMGKGRRMGPGWVAVAAEALANDGLSFWIGVALEYNATTTR